MFSLQASKQHAVSIHARQDPDVADQHVGPLDTDGTSHAVLAFSCKDYGNDATENVSPPLRAMNEVDGNQNAGGQLAVAFKPSHYTRDKDGAPSEVYPALSKEADKGDQEAVIFQTRIARNGRGQPDTVAPALNGADAGETSDMRPVVATRSMVRRLTPIECERLQGFPEISRLAIIRVCGDANLENARSAAGSSRAQKPEQNEPVLAHVQIDLERLEVQIHRAGKLLWSASDAERQGLYRLPIPVEDFALLAAHMTAIAVPTIRLGREASPANIRSSFHRLTGSACVNVSGREIDALVEDATAFTATANRCTKSITSRRGQDSQHAEQSWQTFVCFAVNAISSFIPPQTLRGNSYTVMLETMGGYTSIPYRTGLSADGPRYKALGNSMSTNVMRWLGRRIEMVLALDQEPRD